MSIIIKVRTKGQAQFERKLQRVVIRALNGVSKGLLSTGRDIMKQSKENAPVDTGNLVRSAYTAYPGVREGFTPVFRSRGHVRTTSAGKRRTKVSMGRLMGMGREHIQMVRQAGFSSRYKSNINQQVVFVGHTAFYAPIVHEDMVKQPKAKFLTRAGTTHGMKLSHEVGKGIMKELNKLS